MHTSFADQLAGLDLAGSSIGPGSRIDDFPVREAAVQTLEAVWSDLFAMVSGNRSRSRRRGSWLGFVNIFTARPNVNQLLSTGRPTRSAR